MKIIATQSIYDGERLHPAETVIDWPDARPLPLEFEVRPATPADAPALYNALEQQHARRVAAQERACNVQGLQPQVLETRLAALDRYREALARVVDKARVRKRAKGAAEDTSAADAAAVADPLT